MRVYSDMNFCSLCGSTMTFRVPQGDSLPRHICQSCGEVHYQNPKLVIGCIAEWEEKILLCRRAIEPRHGFWTLPAGFMENGESTVQAALRETYEEACARVEIDSLFSLVNLPDINQVHLFYRARLLNADFSAGIESLETMLFSENDIPWNELAFRSVELCIKTYFTDRRTGIFKFHEEVLMTPPATDLHSD